MYLSLMRVSVASRMAKPSAKSANMIIISSLRWLRTWQSPRTSYLCVLSEDVKSGNGCMEVALGDWWDEREGGQGRAVMVFFMSDLPVVSEISYRDNCMTSLPRERPYVPTSC